MQKKYFIVLMAAIIVVTFIQCSKSTNTQATTYPAITAKFGNNIDVNNLANYANQTIPTYIRKDNTGGNTITNAKATLGRVLFYDKSLSINNTVSCASCHKQEFAFSDTNIASHGVEGGTTGRHSMRLINARFATDTRFFWDKRAATLEQQTTKPLQDHAEMGYSGQNGRGNLDTLLKKLQSIDYYNELFKFVYGDVAVTENRLQECLAQFIRSIQSFDSKYDAGRATAANDAAPFTNFTQQENDGKNLFITPPVFNTNSVRINGGLGCNGCHNAPEFDSDPNSGNNGIIGKVTGVGIDLTNTKAPSLRDLVNSTGNPNSSMMHTAVFKTLKQVIGHYGNITANPNNTNLDNRLKPNGIGQQLNLTAQEVDAVVAFLKTLTGTNVYADKKWSNPFL